MYRVGFQLYAEGVLNVALLDEVEVLGRGCERRVLLVPWWSDSSLSTEERRAGDAVEGLPWDRDDGFLLRNAAADVGRTPRVRSTRSTSRRPSRVLRSSRTGCNDVCLVVPAAGVVNCATVAR